MLKELLGLHRSDQVIEAQVEAFKRRVPLLYVILAINTVAMMVTHWGQGTMVVVGYIPGALITFMLVRAVFWFRLRDVAIDAERGRRLIKQTTFLAAGLAAGIFAWAAEMYRVPVNPVAYGITGFGHAVLYIGLTVVCCISLLMHVRVAATLVTVVVMLPFCVYLFYDGSLVERAVAVNIGIVTAGMLYVMMTFSKDFEELVQTRHDLSNAAAQQTLLANTDALTGLANRRQFFQILRERCEQKAPFSLLMIDLDGFKQVNDLYGHLAGDEVLTEIAARIAGSYGARLCLSRIGGDEFAIICGMVNPQVLLERARNVITACQVPIAIEGAKVSVGASIGITIVVDDAFAANPLRHIEEADCALASAKESGKGQAHLFSTEHEERVRRSQFVEQALLQADLANEIAVHYQPIHDTSHGGLRGYEALARWSSPMLGNVSPAEFVPIAERSQVIHALTRVVLTKALAEASMWPSWVRLKINLSGRDLVDHPQMLAIFSIVAASGFPTSRLTFELTETALVEDASKIMDAVNAIKASGADLAIDDFGTGYSSLSYIHHLSPDLIKIDRSFVSRIGRGDGAEQIIKLIVELCRVIGTRSLAEGVETREQAAFMRELGVDELQGYLFSRPLPANDLPAYFGSSINNQQHLGNQPTLTHYVTC